jgi:hypothetical protein
MFVFDVETLGKESNSIILSFACVHFDDENKSSPDYMRDTSFFVKVDASDQRKRLNRTYQVSTMDWWKKQCENVRIKSYIPKTDDVKIEDAIEQFRTWSKQFKEPKSWIWARGNLDQLVIDSVEEQLKVEPVFHFSRWRDVRTGVDFLCGTDNGYSKIEYPGFDSFLNITKHDPLDDCILDAMMLLYGVKV